MHQGHCAFSNITILIIKDKYFLYFNRPKVLTENDLYVHPSHQNVNILYIIPFLPIYLCPS